MKKWLWRILLGVSSCLLVAVCVLWVRSASRSEIVSWKKYRSAESLDGAQHYSVHSCMSRCYFMSSGDFLTEDKTGASAPLWDDLHWNSFPLDRMDRVGRLDLELTPDDGRWWNRLGFHAGQREDSFSGRSEWLIAAPHWFLIALFSLPLLIEIVRRYRRRRRKQIGLCQTCGYDLRASVDRCPECGTVIAADASGGGVRAS